MDEHPQIQWLRLVRLRGVGPILVKRLLETFHSPQAILEAHPASLAAVEGIGTIKANQIVSSAPGTLQPAQEEFARLQAAGYALLTLDDPAYPPALKTVPDPPLVLYRWGTLEPADTLALGIVGARKCTLYGREQSQRLSAQLAERGFTIISGGARGIDTCAHLGALQVGGRTLVIAGCGLLHTYPPENAHLYERIVKEGRGAILTECPLDAPPSKENFPPRNRIIAGMSLGILVVEANLQSGSLITARLAAADYGREVFALPGRVDSPASAGTHYLIRSAMAHLVESAEDILAHLGDVGRVITQAEPARVAAQQQTQLLFQAVAQAEQRSLTSVQQKIISALTSAKPVSLDEILDATGLPPQLLIAEMTSLQIAGIVSRAPGNRFLLKP